MFWYDNALRVHLHHHTTFVFLPEREKSWSIWMHAIVGWISIFQELGMSNWTTWKVPLMSDLTVNIYKVDSAGTNEMGEEGVSGREFVRIDALKTKTATNKCALLHAIRRNLLSKESSSEVSCLYGCDFGRLQELEFTVR